MTATAEVRLTVELIDARQHGDDSHGFRRRVANALRGTEVFRQGLVRFGPCDSASERLARAMTRGEDLDEDFGLAVHLWSNGWRLRDGEPFPWCEPDENGGWTGRRYSWDEVDELTRWTTT